jgi:hypothetical protein
MASSGSGRRWWTAAAPAADALLGRRRSWLLLSQLAIMAGLVGMALADPRLALGPMVWCALAVAFGSATQDIALDAYRIESADTSARPRWPPPTRPATAGHDLGRRRRAVDCRARRGGRCGRAPTSTAPGRPPTW